MNARPASGGLGTVPRHNSRDLHQQVNTCPLDPNTFKNCRSGFFLCHISYWVLRIFNALVGIIFIKYTDVNTASPQNFFSIPLSERCVRAFTKIVLFIRSANPLRDGVCGLCKVIPFSSENSSIFLFMYSPSFSRHKWVPWLNARSRFSSHNLGNNPQRYSYFESSKSNSNSYIRL